MCVSACAERIELLIHINKMKVVDYMKESVKFFTVAYSTVNWSYRPVNILYARYMHAFAIIELATDVNIV